MESAQGGAVELRRRLRRRLPDHCRRGMRARQAGSRARYVPCPPRPSRRHAEGRAAEDRSRPLRAHRGAGELRGGAMTIELRPYQLQAVADFEREVAAGRRKILLISPTGTGKTVTFCEITRRCTAQYQSVLVI